MQPKKKNRSESASHVETTGEDGVNATVAPRRFELPPLPWAREALTSKGFSTEQIHFHYDKHHQGYVTKLNAAAESKPELFLASLEDLIQQEKGPIYNLAAQIWNHTFFWQCLSPSGGGSAKGALLNEIEASFGTFERFKEEFTTAAVNHFGSGWAWLVRDKRTNKLVVVQTHDAGNPLSDGLTPLLTCDVWEHAYYVDYRNDRAAYVKAFWGAVDWDFVTANHS
jgi:Fe-Mn family superoxide dismutase